MCIFWYFLLQDKKYEEKEKNKKGDRVNRKNHWLFHVYFFAQSRRDCTFLSYKGRKYEEKEKQQKRRESRENLTVLS